MTQNGPQKQPLTKYIIYMLQHSLFKTFISAFSQGNGSKRPLILYYRLEASGGRVVHRFAFLEFFFTIIGHNMTIRCHMPTCSFTQNFWGKTFLERTTVPQ